MEKDNLNQENLRPVEITHGFNKVKGFFHGWTQDIGNTTESVEFIYKLAIVEIEENGEVLRVHPENIRFMDRKK